MDCEANMHDILERMLRHAHLEPTQLPLSLLKAITNNFSDGQQIGSGGFAVVYKGLLRNGTSVAVKKLSETFVVDEEKFCQELDSLMRVKHKNIVRFLGYCADTQGKVCKWEGKNVMAEERQRLLCFEFMPKGSLDKYIKDMTQELDWRTVYKIIKGICEGLHYLHENKIVHLDLKPANILLDDYMVPKISDFGISRCFDEKQTRAATSNLYGTLGYMAPEFYNKEITITFKSDIYSLGTVIIEMLTGRKGYPDIDNVLANWSARFGNVPAGDPRLEHVKACVKMGIKCIDLNPQRRPITQHIIDMLVDMDHIYGFNETDFCASSAALVPAPTKRGPWGGNGGSLHEMEGKSQRLECVTINHGGVVHAIGFSYIDENGRYCTTGIWGMILENGPDKTETIKFGPSELVKQITGSGRPETTVGFRHLVYITKFQIVTNHQTYGPFGTDDGTTSFSYTVLEDETVVGFFASTEDRVYKIGLYTI